MEAELRPLHHIHDSIRRDWKKPHYAAIPYIQALRYLGTCEDMYGLETGDMIVARFLDAATTWRGDTARAVKAELKAHLKRYNEEHRGRY